MSKDMSNKGSAQSKPPSGSKPPSSSSKPSNAKVSTQSKPPVSSSSKAAPPRNSQSQQRKGTPPPSNSAFGNRDLTLLIGGVMVVIFVIIGALLLGNRGATTPTQSETITPGSTAVAEAPTTTDQAPVIMEPGVAATASAQAVSPPHQTAEAAFQNHTNITPVPPGQIAPDFTLPGTDGKTYTLSSYRGKQPVLVEFMAPWCPHCQDNSVYLNEIYDKYNSKGLQMFGVSSHPYGLGWEEQQKNPITMNDLTWFRDNFKVQYPLLYDPVVKSGDDYGIAYFPTIYIIDSEGRIVTNITAERGNPISTERIAAEVDKVIKQP